MLPKELYKRIPIILFYIMVFAFTLYLIIRYIIPLFLPFIISWVLALLLQKPINKLKEKANIPKKLSSLVLVLLFTVLIAFICYIAVDRIYHELVTFAGNAVDILDKIKSDSTYSSYWIDKINGFIPFIDIGEWLSEKLGEFDVQIGETVTFLTGQILPVLGSMITVVPKIIMYVIVVLFSSYYFTVDFDKINRTVTGLLPAWMKKYFSAAKRETYSALGKIIRAYGLILFITFAELFISFTIIGFDYALILAMIIAVIDILPVLGTGTVLVPWGLILLILGDTRKGFAILAVFAVISVIREIAEPKIVGKSMGVHPIVTLVSMYVGLEVFGFFGLFFIPIVITLGKNIISKSGIFKKSVSRRSE